MRRLIDNRESGAVAVLFALLAVVVIGAGALAVDLGNAFARKRISQTQADLAALAGAAELPNDSAAIDEAFNYLVRNVTPNQGDVSTYKTIMTNGSQADGEIWIESSERVNVLTPPAEVDYALGGVFQQYGIDVQAYAQAGVFSPGVIAPFFIPYGCSTPLPSEIFVKSGAESTPTEPTPVFPTPMVAKKTDLPSVDTVTPTEVASGVPISTRTANDAQMEATDPTLASAVGAISEAEILAGVSVTVTDATFTASGAPRNETGVDVSGDTLTSVSPIFSDTDVGSKVEIPGAGLAGGPRVTVIESFVSDTEVVIAAPATSPLTGVTITITPGDVGDLTADVDLYISETAVDLSAAPDLDVVNGEVTIRVTNTDKVEVTGDGFRDDGLGMEVAFVRGTSIYIVQMPASSVYVEKYKTPRRDAIELVPVPAEVVSISGSDWYILVREWTVDDSASWSFAEDKKNEAILSVSSSADPADECGERVTGDFGLLNSPRSDTNVLQERLDLNIAKGIDHGVQEFPDAPLASGAVDITAKDNCRVTPSTPVTGGILDDDATLSSGGVPNCLEINNGNKVDATTDGLITGGTKPYAFDGRLVADSWEFCPRPLRTGVLGSTINDDVLSCFLESGSIQGAVSGTDPKFLGEIVSSPRFMFVPVLWATVNPQNGYYPIERFAAAYITEQLPTTNKGNTASSNEPDNGVVIGTTKVQGITVIPFEMSRLPEQIDYDGEVIPYIGSGPKVVRLLQ